MESASYWLLFLSAAFAINISPGPDLIYILSKTVAQGSKIGIASSLGVCTGSLVHVLAAAPGLSAILATSAMAFSVVKYIGAAYLIYLGIQTLRSRGMSIEEPAKNEIETSVWKAFRQGALVDIFNPKVAIFYMSFLPQFIRPELGHKSVQIIILGILVTLIAIPVVFFAVFTASQTTDLLRKNRNLSVWIDRVLGSILIGLGVRLALTDNNCS